MHQKALRGGKAQGCTRRLSRRSGPPREPHTQHGVSGALRKKKLEPKNDPIEKKEANHKLPLEHRGTTRHFQLPVERLRQLNAIRSFTEALRLKKSLRTLTR